MGALRDGMSGTHGAVARECRQVGDSAGRDACGGARRSARRMGLRRESVGRWTTVQGGVLWCPQVSGRYGAAVRGCGEVRDSPGGTGRQSTPSGKARGPGASAGVSGTKGCAWESRGLGRVSAGGRLRREAGLGAERLARVSGSDRDCQSWAHRGAKGQGRAPHHSGGLRCARRVSEERRGVTEQRGAIRSESGRKRARAPTANRADALPRCGGADRHPPGLVGWAR